MTIKATLTRVVFEGGGSPQMLNAILAAVDGEPGAVSEAVRLNGGSPGLLSDVKAALGIGRREGPVAGGGPELLILSADERAELHRTGLVVIPGRFDGSHQLDAARRVAAQGERVARDAGEPLPGLLDGGGAYSYRAADADAVEEGLPDFAAWYRAQPVALTSAFGRDVVVSPYPRSAFTLKLYGPGDQQGWHYDTNPVTVLLWLTSSPPEGALEVRDRTGEVRRVAPRAGSILLMWGRELWHRVLPQPERAERIMVALNYYFADDTWRPEGIDSLIYAGQA